MIISLIILIQLTLILMELSSYLVMLSTMLKWSDDMGHQTIQINIRVKVAPRGVGETPIMVFLVMPKIIDNDLVSPSLIYILST